MLVGLAGVGRVCPNGVIDDLGGFFQFHVQRGFHQVQTLLKPIIAALANCSWLVCSLVVFFQAAAKTGSGIDLHMSSVELRLELAQEVFPLFF